MKDGHEKSDESTRTTYKSSKSTKTANNSDFPVVDLVPKKETNSLEFQSKNPTYDGRNVIIGILDTGVDPGAAGIRYMQDGITPKLIDLVDCTGSCDVDVSLEQDAHWVAGDCSNNYDTTAVVTVQENMGDDGYWQVQALSGRTLKLSKDWKICPFPIPSTKPMVKSSTNTPLDDTTTTSTMTPNLSDNPSLTPTSATCRVRLGLKRAFELFPEPLINRVKTHRKRQLDKDRDAYIETARKRLAEYKETTFTISNGNSSSNGGKTATPEQIKQRDDLQAYIDLLSDDDTWNNDNDPGLLLDCVVFWDGHDYRAVIDATDASSSATINNKDGDLRLACPMTDFRKERQFSTISTVDQYNYGVNFYDNGSVLSIVGDITPHGTHVGKLGRGKEYGRSV
jgi:tripeptidyl-peptidase II